MIAKLLSKMVYKNMIFKVKNSFRTYDICFYGFSVRVCLNIKDTILMLLEYTKHPIFEQYGALNVA